jgi:hypothetical protein
MSDWTAWWGVERRVDDLSEGEILCFIKSPSWRGEYGAADALISAIDCTPLTHCALVVSSGGRPEIAHSTLAGRRLEQLGVAAQEHRFAPLFVLRPRHLTERTLEAIAHRAKDLATESGSSSAYPFTDLFAAAVLLRLRMDTDFDEHAHAHAAAEIAAGIADGGGRMCAAFLAACFEAEGIGLGPLDEAPPRVMSRIDQRTGPYSGELQLLAAAVAEEHESGGGDLAGSLGTLAAELASSAPAADDFTAWLRDPGSRRPECLAELAAAYGRLMLLSPAPLPSARFMTVGDLARSTSMGPAGFVRYWWSDEHILNREPSPDGAPRRQRDLPT